MKILLVEDNRTQQMAVKAAVRKAGHDIYVASDGESAMCAALEHHPHVILLDMMLPKMSGPDVLHALKQNPDTARIPVVVLSALSQGNEGRLVGEGAAGYIEKSPEMLMNGAARLLALLERVTNQKAAAPLPFSHVTEPRL